MSDGPAIFGARRAMPVEDILDRASSPSLDEMLRRVGGIGPLEQEVVRDREQVAALAATLLEPGMRPLIEWLCDITLRKPIFMPNLGPEGVAYCAWREGQNQIVYQLLRAAAEGRSQTIEPRDGMVS